MKLSYEEYVKSLPKKRGGAAAIFFNTAGELLVVKPNYREDWLTPGGTIDALESPLQCCKREIREELGLTIENLEFVGVNYIIGTTRTGDRDEGYHFVFYCGVLTDEQIASIVLQKEELDEFRFVPVEEGLKMLNERLAMRIRQGIEAHNKNQPFYSEYKKK